MNPFITLISDIKARLDKQEATGWYSCHCPVCNETRTRTGGFLFTDDQIVYNCFRGKCDASCGLTVGEYVSKKFKNLMQTMGVRIPIEILTVKRKGKLASAITDLDDALYSKHVYKNIDIPEGWVPFNASSKTQFKERIYEYLYDRYSDAKDIFVIEKGPYTGMGAIGMYHGQKLIGFHVITGKKYVAHFDGNSNILYMPNRYPSDTTIVVEGAMDARSLPNVVATLGDKVTKEQAYHLRDKRVILLPDRGGNCKFIKQFAQYGWEICIPPWDAKDLNQAVQKYGKLCTTRMILEGIEKDPVKARVKFDLWKEK